MNFYRTQDDSTTFNAWNFNQKAATYLKTNNPGQKEEEQPTCSHWKKPGQKAEEQPEMTMQKKLLKPNQGSKPTPKTPPLVRTHIFRPLKKDIKHLKYLVQINVIPCISRQTIYYYWMLCFMDTIEDVMTKFYALKIECTSDELYQRQWRIRTRLDTWTGRSFQPGEGQSFSSHQRKQRKEFYLSRAGDPLVEVKLEGYLSVITNETFTHVRLEVKPLPGDQLGMKLHNPLAKLFRSMRSCLTNYSFKEKAANWKMIRTSADRDNDFFEIRTIIDLEYR